MQLEPLFYWDGHSNLIIDIFENICEKVKTKLQKFIKKFK